MKKYYQILFYIFLFQVIACSKNSTDTTIVTPPTTSTTSLPDTASFYNNLSVFTKQGATWDCIRYDTIVSSRPLNSSTGPVWGNWIKNLVWDTSRREYRDSSFETFSVKGTISIGDLKKYYGYTNWNAAQLTFSNLVYHPEVSYAYDTSMCSILLINNKNRKTIDTEFVFLSKSYFAMIPQNIGPQGAFAGVKDHSFIELGILLSKINPGQENFYFQNKLYQGDLSLTKSLSSGGNPTTSSYDSTYIDLSKIKGLFKHFNYYSYRDPLGSAVAKVYRMNINN